MIQPMQHILKPRQNRAGGHNRAVHQDHRQAQFPCRQQLGRGPLSSGVLGHDPLNPMRTHKGHIPNHIKRSARNFSLPLRQRHVLWRIDQAQQIVMLRSRCEHPKRLFSDRQKHPRGGLRQGGQRGAHVWNMMPGITGLSLPRRALKGQQIKPHRRAGNLCITAHIYGKRMCCINDFPNIFSAQIGLQARDAAKASDPCGQGLRYGIGCPSGIGKHRVLPALRQNARETRGLARAPKQKDARHV